MPNSIKSKSGPLSTGILEPSKFHIQLANTEYGSILCAKCTLKIDPSEDSEHVIIWPANAHTDSRYSPLHFHIVCYGEAVSGMVEFFKVFIVDKSKRRVIQ